MTKKEAIEMAAQAWCDPETSDRVMDSELANAVAKRLIDAYDQGILDVLAHLDGKCFGVWSTELLANEIRAFHAKQKDRR